MIKKRKIGFTLPELLVTVAILSLVGTIILTIFVRSLRGNNKSQILQTIKQNGQAVLDVMDRNVRNSDEVVCSSNSEADLVQSINTNISTIVTVQNGAYTRYRIVPPRLANAVLRSDCMNITDTDLTQPTNGCIVSDNPVPVTDCTGKPAGCVVDVIPTLKDDNGNMHYSSKFIDDKCNPTDPLVNPNVLTDTKLDSGISVTGSFTEMKQSGFRDVVSIDFNLGPGIKAPAVVAGQIDLTQFHTTVGLR